MTAPGTDLSESKAFDFNITYYLSGPMSGYENHNFEAFELAAQHLRDSGVSLIAPSELKPPQDEPEEMDYLAHDFAVMSSACKGIILLKGWPASRGARAELEIALTLGWPVYFYHDFALIDMNRIKR